MIRQIVVAVVVVVIGATTARAEDAARGTAKQAQQMVELGILLFEDEGAAGAFAAINTGLPDFRNRDLYLFVVETDGLVVANALNRDLVGTNAIDLKDANEVAFVQRMIERATANGAWVDYLYVDPLTGTVTPKSSWVVRHGDYIFGCGIYKP